MLKFLVKALGLIAGLALSGTVFAVGMGGINVTTALGEPLKAEIELVAVGKIEKGSLSARLASPDVFKGAGMDYPIGLPTLKFQIEARADGAQYLKVTSAQPVNEPFVSLLVELNWSSGKLLREYTFLLDPPGYVAEQPKAAEVAPVPSKVEGAEAVKKETATMRATAPVDERVFADSPASKKPAEGGNAVSGSIKVKRGDTLSQIAREVKSSDISMERMLVALYRANADAFDGQNMNRLRTGKILRMPEQSDLGKLAQMDAVKEIHAQVADWHAYRQKLAAASARVAEQAPRQETSGKISTTVADKAPAAKESAKEVVRLSKGEAPGDKTAAGGNAKNLQDKIHALEEEATARGKALKESNERVAMLEKNIKEMQRLLDLKGQPAVAKPETTKPEVKAEPAKVEAKPPTPAPAVSAAPDVVAKPAATTPEATPPSTPKPAAKPVVAPKVVAPPPSMLDEPLYLAGGAAALLALGGLGFVLIRRKGVKLGKAPESKKAAEDADNIGSRISAPIASSPETGDFTQASAVASAIQEPDDVDPISEADLFLNFGRDAQAEEILKDALGKTPANNQIRLKLLSIYAKRKDTNSFSSVARQIQDSGDAAAWAQAAEMGHSMEPGNPMYGVADGGSVAVAAEGQDRNEQPVGLDFDLGFGTPEAAAAPEAESTAMLDAPLAQSADNTYVMDFDLGIGEPEAAATPEAESAMALDASMGEETVSMSAADLLAAPMDFDITATHPPSAAMEQEQATTITPNLDDLVFDVTAIHPSLASAAEEKTATDTPVGNDGGMEFTLDFPIGDEPVAPAAQVSDKQTVDFDLDGISLDMDEPSASAQAPASEVKDAHWHDVATKLDLAKAYQEMGDNAGAREILEEVLAEGDEQQRATAEATIKQLLA